MRMRTVAAAAVLTLAAAAATARAQDALNPGDRVAVCGDSITEQHLYSADLEAYLALCRPTSGVTVEQFGWSGETAAGFRQKMHRFVLPFGNTVATTCYGMNDGRYAPLTDAVAAAYRKSQTSVVQALRASGVHLVVLGSPGMVDPATFGRPGVTAEQYNRTLAALGDIDRDVAREQKVAFADVHAALAEVMPKAKAAFGDAYPLCGPDGIHPQANGHLVMAYAFLKALNVDGDLGTVTFDGQTQRATATGGHAVLSCSAGTIQLESTRYPFCFAGDPKSPDATTGVIQFMPFNDDLNRFRLVATNVGSDRVRVTFGKAAKEFAAADLARGINLAAEFLDNPFSGPFATEMRQVQAKQAVETQLDLGFLNANPPYEARVPQARAAYDAFRPAVGEFLAEQAKAIVDHVPPVRYAIRVEPVR